MTVRIVNTPPDAVYATLSDSLQSKIIHNIDSHHKYLFVDHLQEENFHRNLNFAILQM